MVRFNTNYLNQFDARYYPSEIGTTVSPTIEAPQGVEAQLRSGARLVEISVADPGQAWVARARGGPIPSGAYTKEQRQELKELGQVNKAAMTVHAGSSTSFAPLGREGVDEFQRQRNLDEIKSNVDFAHDIKADSVTVHIIGTPRPVQELGEEKLRPQGLEQYSFADMKTGKLVVQLSGSDEILIPKLVKNDRGQWDYLYDEQTGGIQYYKPQDMGLNKPTTTFDDAVQYFQKSMNQGAFRDYQEKNYSGADVALLHYLRQKEILQQSEYDRWQVQSRKLKEQMDLLGKEGDEHKLIDYIAGRKDPTHLSITQLNHLKERAEQLTNSGFSFGVYFDPNRPDTWNSARERVERTWDMMRQEQRAAMERTGHSYDSLNKTKDLITDYNDGVNQYPLRIQSLSKLAEKQNVEGIVDVAMHSYRRSKETKNNVMINPENIFPHFYGSHPDELKEVIIKSRNELARQMQQEGVDKSHAKKLSEEFIGACFDVGHANMWRRYWQEEKGEKKGFEDWLADKAEGLAKEGIIKKVHINDNFGYEDDSLPPGTGIVPIKKVVDRIRKYEGKIPIISEGYGGPKNESWKQVTEAWRAFNPHVYNQATVLSGQVGETWDKLHYFDTALRSYTPTFLAGPAVPEVLAEDFRTWDDIPLE